MRTFVTSVAVMPKIDMLIAGKSCMTFQCTLQAECYRHSSKSGAYWRFHGKQGHDLEQMVLNDVTDDAILVKVAAAALCAKVFTEDDLHIADEGPAPQGLKDEVSKPQHLSSQAYGSSLHAHLGTVAAARFLQCQRSSETEINLMCLKFASSCNVQRADQQGCLGNCKAHHHMHTCSLESSVNQM